ncbi:MAG: TIGR02099 family protein [Nitrosospira sp.]|nr:TIGR02099 family protein [Nitrosospira sp.]
MLTWVLIVVVLFFSILLLSLRYWMLPGIEQYRESIASAISHTSGQRVTIGGISANWDGLRPHMILRAIKVHDKEGNATLLLDRLEGTLSWRFLLGGELRFREIGIEQPNLIVRRDVAGVIHVAGFALSGELTGSDNGFSDWLLRQRQVMINNASILWQDDQRGAPELEFLVNLRLENHGNHHRFGIRATPSAEFASQLDVRGDFTGKSLASLEQWQGRLFVQIDHADIAAWYAWLPFPQEIQLHRGFGALRIWAGMDGADLKKLTTDMHLRNVKTRLAPGLPELNLLGLQGRVGWQEINDGTKKGVELFAHRLITSVRGKHEPQPVNFLLQVMPARGEKSGSGKLEIDGLNLEILGELAEYLPIGESVRERLERAAPHGEIHSMRARWDGEWSSPARFSAKGGFVNLGMKKSDNLPAFSGVTGNIDVNDRGGTLNLNSQQVRLELSDVFQEPLVLDTLTGQATWNLLTDEDSIAFKFSNVSFSNPHAAGLAYGSYRTMPDGPGVIDLVSHLTRADARYVLRYMPIGVDRLDRLAESIVGGEITDARLHLKGDLAEFPFARTDTGIFRLHVKVAGIALDNIPGWPRIDDISGNLQFHGSRMKFDASQANISGTRLSKATLHIADITASNAILKSEGEMSGSTREFLKFAAKYTSGGYIDRLADDINIAGNGKLLFKVDIPLQHPDDSKLAGSYRLIDNRIDPGPRIPNLDNVNGVLAFDGTGITLENVTARFLGGPVVLNSTGMPDGSTRLSAIGKVNLDNLYEPSQGGALDAAPRWTRHLRGSTDWRALIHLHDKLVDVSVESSLKGITSDLPEPFSKIATDVTPLRFERRAIDFDKDVLNLSYGGLVTAKIKRLQDNAGNYHAERGIVSFGPTPGSMPEKTGISVGGTLPLLNLDQWRSLLMQFDDKAGSKLNLTDTTLHVGALDFLGKRLNDLTLNASKDDELWHAAVASREIKGGISWDPAENGKVVARLRTLAIPAASPPGARFITQTQQQEKNLPALDVMADSFIINDKAVGRLELIAHPQEQSWRVEKLHIINPDSSLIAKGTCNLALRHLAYRRP